MLWVSVRPASLDFYYVCLLPRNEINPTFVVIRHIKCIASPSIRPEGGTRILFSAKHSW